MPKYQRYPGENPVAARKRIMKNRMNSRKPMTNSDGRRRMPGSGGSRVMRGPTASNSIRRGNRRAIAPSMQRVRNKRRGY